jgi:hypothetical protein
MSFFNHFRAKALLRRSIPWRQPNSMAIKA